jgi:hypothetical protein
VTGACLDHAARSRRLVDQCTQLKRGEALIEAPAQRFQWSRLIMIGTCRRAHQCCVLTDAEDDRLRLPAVRDDHPPDVRHALHHTAPPEALEVGRWDLFNVLQGIQRNAVSHLKASLS